MNDDRLDLLVSRAIDRVASDAEWQELEMAAGVGPEPWERLAQTLRAEGRVASGLLGAVAVADAVALPAPRVASRFVRLRHGIAAAAIVMALVAGWSARGLVASDPAPRGENATLLDYDDAFARCVAAGVRSGTLVDELPVEVVHQAKTSSGNAFEVYFVRRLVERRVLPELYRIDQDERGRPVVGRIAPDQFRQSHRF